MLNLTEKIQRRTATDDVFDQLYEEINTLKILPGAKLSEAEIALRFGVSRQPVRDAFNRLENLNLLLIRPQRATIVRGFSMNRTTHARFVRLAVELEVIRHASTIWDQACVDALDENLGQQQQALENKQPEQFHQLDYQFHKLICELGGCTQAFNTIEECKKQVARLCVLSLNRKDEFTTLFDDHLKLAEGLKNGTAEDATSVARKHLARLDDVIAEVHDKHSEYFE